MNTNLNREEAIALVGEANVNAVESKNCEPTGKVGNNGSSHGDSLTEWSASIACSDKDGNDVTLIAYYYTTNEQNVAMDAAGDGAAIDWSIYHFEVV